MGLTMTTKSEESSALFWGVVAIGLLATVIGSCQGSGGGGSASTSYTPSRSSVEHRYATERFKQEGFSTSDAQKAADAVIKFHNAQKNK